MKADKENNEVKSTEVEANTLQSTPGPISRQLARPSLFRIKKWFLIILIPIAVLSLGSLGYFAYQSRQLRKQTDVTPTRLSTPSSEQESNNLGTSGLDPQSIINLFDAQYRSTIIHKEVTDPSILLLYWHGTALEPQRAYSGKRDSFEIMFPDSSVQKVFEYFNEEIDQKFNSQGFIKNKDNTYKIVPAYLPQSNPLSSVYINSYVKDSLACKIKIFQQYNTEDKKFLSSVKTDILCGGIDDKKMNTLYDQIIPFLTDNYRFKSHDSVYLAKNVNDVYLELLIPSEERGMGYRAGYLKKSDKWEKIWNSHVDSSGVWTDSPDCMVLENNHAPPDINCWDSQINGYRKSI